MKLCTVQGCTNIHRAKGYCGRHYKQWRKGRLGKTVSRDGSQGCRVTGCQSKHEAMGFCSKHYKRLRRGTISIEGRDIKKRPRCRVVDCQESRYKGGYCEQHHNRLLLMKDLWLNKVLPTYSTRKAVGLGVGSYPSRTVSLEDIRADLDYDYAAEGDYYSDY